MKNLKASEIRQKYLDFFVEKVTWSNLLHH